MEWNEVAEELGSTGSLGEGRLVLIYRLEDDWGLNNIAQFSWRLELQSLSLSQIVEMAAKYCNIPQRGSQGIHAKDRQTQYSRPSTILNPRC